MIYKNERSECEMRETNVVAAALHLIATANNASVGLFIIRRQFEKVLGILNRKKNASEDLT